jgi:23S rRNA pseudouridine1911/1915/1917 synthase
MKYYYKFFIIFIVLCLIYLLIKFNINKNSKDLEILYEDDYIIVIVKPVSIASHDAPNWDGKTVVQKLINNGYTLYNDNYSYQDGIVHRLDVGTSGLMVLAKNKFAYDYLKKQFKYRTVIKKYITLIEGEIEPTSGTINEPIRTVYNNGGVDPNGKPSVSHYKTLRVFPESKVFPTLSLIEVDLETGRTHQIRIHFSHMKHPLVGDFRYGANRNLAAHLGINHQWLHAKYLEFNHPLTGKRLMFNSEIPFNLKQTLDFISNNKLVPFTFF